MIAALLGFLVGGMDGFAGVYFQPDHPSPKPYAVGHTIGRWVGSRNILGVLMLLVAVAILVWVVRL
jgi:hypothetical protein